MKFLSKDHLLTWGVPVMLACVLVGVAILQYRWSHQVSEAATTRMQAGLQNSMMNFRRDLSRDLAMMCMEMQGDGDETSIDAKRLAQELERWQRTSSLSGAAANIYEWNQSRNSSPGLLKFVPAEAKFESVAWPFQFDELRERLTTTAPRTSHEEPDADDVFDARLDHGGDRPGPGSRVSKPVDATNDFMIGGIDQGIPVLIVPASRRSHSTWLLVELNAKVLEDRVFPQLATRYFGDPSSSDYEVAVVADLREHPRVLYSSDSGFGQNGQINTDATLNLFGPPALQGGPAPPPVDFVPTFRTSSRYARQPSSSIGQAGISQPGTTFDGIRFDPVHYRQGNKDWQIIVQHRKGSVAAAVAELRRQNLAISFGVLLVLAAAMALIVFNSQRARRLAMLQMDFVAGVSHELRTPVAAILSISENIVDGVVEDEKQLLRYGGLIRNQAKRLSHLVEQVLRFSATQRTTTSYTIRPLQVADVIDEVLENLANLVSISGFMVERRIEPNLPLVDADFGVVSQCLQNLMTNALKYGGDSKWIGVRVAAITQGATREVTITVEDRGIGIEQQELKHIFEPFYRSPKIVESQVPGDGLGLALAKNFAEAMGGRLTVVSEIGKGTSFTIHLPASSEADPSKMNVLSVEAPEGRTMRMGES